MGETLDYLESNITPRPTTSQLQSQVKMGLAESGHRYQEGSLSGMQLGSTIRRARHNGIPVIRIAQITGLSVSKVIELENTRYVGGYDEDGSHPTAA